MRTKKEKAINYDLWEKLLIQVEKHKVQFNWVRGHNGHEENERCDELATEEILNNSASHLVSKNNTSSLTPKNNTSPLAPLLSGEGDSNELTSNVIVNYKNVPKYVKELSKDLRRD